MDNAPQGTIYANGQFSLNDTWRWGFNIARASSANYVRDFHLSSRIGNDPNLLSSQVYAEGFGQGAYSRFDIKFYQSLNDTIVGSKLPLVLPRYESVISVNRMPWADDSASTLEHSMCCAQSAPRPAAPASRSTGRDRLSERWVICGRSHCTPTWRLITPTHLISSRTSARIPQVNAARAQPQAALDFRWPFMRDSGAWGTHLIEPIAQIIVAPQIGDSQFSRFPNEDSLDLEFSDANLFGFNRFPGIDRLEGGVRANVALHGAWYLGGTAFDTLIGQSFRTTKDYSFPQQSGLQDQVSDVVARASLAPTTWLNLTYRTRLDYKTFATRMADAVATIGVPKFSVSAGYTYSTYNPYSLYDQPPPPPVGSSFFAPRNEVTLAVTSNWGKYRFSGWARRNVQLGQMVSLGADAAYEDECYILDFRYYRRYTNFNGDHGGTTALVQMTFKTIGQFGFKAL